MSLMTGRRPEKLGIYINEHSLSPDVPTMAHSLGLAGYETVLCGRMHFTGPDQRHGYQRRLAGDFTCTYTGGNITDLGERKGSASNLERALQCAGPHENPVMHYDTHVTECCEAFLENRENDAPLFLTVGFYGPHHPWNAPSDLFESARDRLRADAPPVVEAEGETLHPVIRESGAFKSVGPEKVEEVRAAYAAMTEHVDSLFARILEAAGRLPGETLVVYISDHGEMAGDHGLYGKGVFYEASASVPMIWAPLKSGRSPKIPAGKIIDAPVSLMDIAATLTSLGEGPSLPRQDGVNLWPTIESGTIQPPLTHDRPVFSHMKGWADTLPMRMVRKGSYKLNYYWGAPSHELFDLEADPGELHNLWEASDHAAAREELLAAVLDDWDGDAIQAEGGVKHQDMLYLAQWGREVGTSADELWQPRMPPPAEYRGPFVR